MGWCSGSHIFYNTVETIIEMWDKGLITEEAKIAITTSLYEEMKAQDWDCDDPMGIDWVDKIMHYFKCPNCDIIFYCDEGDLCWECEEDA